MTQDSGDFDKFDASWIRVTRLTGWDKKKQLADFLGITGQSVSGARTRNSFPSDWAYRIASRFRGSTDWILEGKGPMRLEGEGLANEIPPPPEVSAKPLADQPQAQDAFDSLGMAEGLGLLAKIYSSGDNIYIRAINANLMAFADAVKTKARAILLEETIHQMQDQMLKMQEQLNELKREVLGLRNENSELKRELRSRSSNDQDVATG